MPDCVLIPNSKRFLFARDGLMHVIAKAFPRASCKTQSCPWSWCVRHTIFFEQTRQVNTCALLLCAQRCICKCVYIYMYMQDGFDSQDDWCTFEIQSERWNLAPLARIILTELTPINANILCLKNISQYGRCKLNWKWDLAREPQLARTQTDFHNFLNTINICTFLVKIQASYHSLYKNPTIKRPKLQEELHKKELKWIPRAWLRSAMWSIGYSMKDCLKRVVFWTTNN